MLKPSENRALPPQHPFLMPVQVSSALEISESLKVVHSSRKTTKNRTMVMDLVHSITTGTADLQSESAILQTPDQTTIKISSLTSETSPILIHHPTRLIRIMLLFTPIKTQRWMKSQKKREKYCPNLKISLRPCSD